MEIPAPSAWRELLTGANAGRSLVLTGGVGLHAVTIFIVTTILPSVVADLGGLAYYAWNTTLFVVASIVGSALAPQALGRLAPRGAYRLAAGLFALGTLVCAAAPSMPVLLAGRGLQGLGGGLLVALSYALIRHLFPAPLWPRAIALVSGMWGAAALAGPFVGGVCAELGTWRVAFWALLPLAAGFVALADRTLVRPAAGGAAPVAAVPVLRLTLLALAVLAVSAASLAGDARLNAIGVAAAVALMAGLRHLDGLSPDRLLPRAAFRPATPLGATYAMMALLVAGTTTIIFVPLLLQKLHGLSPLAAGYLTVVEALAWTVAALATSAVGRRGARRAIGAGPVVMLAGLAGLAWSMPAGGELAAIGLWLALVGGGIGMGWAHLASRVLAVAPERERDLAAASISTVQLLAAAFGSALAGMVANLAGLSDPGGVGGAATASRWLFAVFAAAPALASLAALAVLVGAPEPPRRDRAALPARPCDLRASTADGSPAPGGGLP